MDSQLYNSTHLRTNLQEMNITYNYHKKGLEPESFLQNSKLSNMFHITSTNYDAIMQPFVSTIEAKSYPFYGVQYHPEKNNFEYGFAASLAEREDATPYEHIPHSVESVQLSLHLALFFVTLARTNPKAGEGYSKIEEYPPIFTYPMIRGGGKFEHEYIVPSAEHWEPIDPSIMELESTQLQSQGLNKSLLRGGNTWLVRKEIV